MLYRNIKKCLICSSEDYKKVFLNADKKSLFVQCKKCKLIFQNPLENIEKTISRYGKSYFEYELENQYNFLNIIKRTLNDFNIVERLPESARILEIGSATGLFLKHMNSYGFRCTGVDVCAESVEYGKKHHKVDLIAGTLDTVKFENKSFDFIHFSHLIEHLNHPKKFLTKINNLLNNNGTIMITTPNSSGLFARYYMNLWRCIVDDTFVFIQ